MEEQARLVRSRTSSEASSKASFGTMQPEIKLNDGSGEPPLSLPAVSPVEPPECDLGELLDCTNHSVLDEFHNEALKQPGFSCVQVRIVLACGLAVAGATLELAAIPFILPSAEIELCIQPHEKNWLVLISLVGASIGSLLWGFLGCRAGRRRALVSCLAVNAVFASIAAFMPTYGTFMCARFCSAIGSGGIIPLTYTYLVETCARPCRERILTVQILCAGVGAVVAAELARYALPQTGAEALEENKEHFSKWHRYLLLCMLFIVASLISLIWTPESPRYLLDVGREAEALPIYQSLQPMTRMRLCRSSVSGCGGASYRLSALAPLPPPPPPPTLKRAPPPHHATGTFTAIWQTFSELFSPEYERLTLSYGGVMLLTTVIQFYISSFVPATVEYIESQQFEAAKRTIENFTFLNEHHNSTLENVFYDKSVFNNCSFKDMLMSHVAFKNCTFNNVMFSNIRTSHTFFTGCTFVNNTIIDADIEVGRELDPWCVLNNTSIRGMQGGCNRHADLTSKLSGLILEQFYVSYSMFFASILSLLPYKFRSLSILAIVLIFLVPCLVVVESETTLYLVEMSYRTVLMLIFFAVSFHVTDDFPAHLRCCAHGVIMAGALFGAAAARGAAPHRLTITAIVVTVLAVLNGLVTSCTLPI